MDGATGLYVFVGVLIAIFLIVVIILALLSGQKHQANVDFVDAFNSIKIGDSKTVVFSKLGSRSCTTSLLRDGTEKYEWKIRVGGGSSTIRSQGVGVTSHRQGYTIKMAIKIKNGFVIEKTGDNLDFGTSTESASDNYGFVTLGMAKAKVLSLLGGGYSVSLLKNGTEKYTWKIRHGGITMSTYWGHGFTTRRHSSSTTTKINVVFKDGVVIEKTSSE